VEKCRRHVNQLNDQIGTINARLAEMDQKVSQNCLKNLFFDYYFLFYKVRDHRDKLKFKYLLLKSHTNNYSNIICVQKLPKK
jgi:hypothetical protein